MHIFVKSIKRRFYHALSDQGLGKCKSMNKLPYRGRIFWCHSVTDPQIFFSSIVMTKISNFTFYDYFAECEIEVK